jgi:predicted ester cyclase
MRGTASGRSAAEDLVSLAGNRRVALESFRVIETGDAALADRIIAPDFINREADDDPDQRERQLAGPSGFMATARWLSAAFSDLRFKPIETLAEDERVAVLATMTATHTGSFQGIAPTGKRLQQHQFHLFRLRAGKIIEHSAQRDDLGLLLHLRGHPRADR